MKTQIIFFVLIMKIVVFKFTQNHSIIIFINMSNYSPCVPLLRPLMHSPSCVSISSTSLSFWGFCTGTWFMLSGGVLGAPVLSLAPPPVPNTITPLFFFEPTNVVVVDSFSTGCCWLPIQTVLCELCEELFLVPETVVNLTKCLLAMRPMSAVFRTLCQRGVHQKHIWDRFSEVQWVCVYFFQEFLCDTDTSLYTVGK